MIRGFKHKGLGRFFETGGRSGIQTQHAERLRLILAQLNAAIAPRASAESWLKQQTQYDLWHAEFSFPVLAAAASKNAVPVLAA